MSDPTTASPVLAVPEDSRVTNTATLVPVVVPEQCDISGFTIRRIHEFAAEAKSFADLCWKLGYPNAGMRTRERIRKVIGEEAFKRLSKR